MECAAVQIVTRQDLAYVVWELIGSVPVAKKDKKLFLQHTPAVTTGTEHCGHGWCLVLIRKGKGDEEAGGVKPGMGRKHSSTLW